MDYVTDLNESSYSDLSDPGFNESELEIIEKENRIRETICRDDSVLDCLSRSNSISQGVSPVANSPVRVLTKCESLEENSMNALTPFEYEYEKNTISNTPNSVVNAKGWIWIAGIQGCGDCPKNGMEMALAQLKGKFIRFLRFFLFNFFCCDFLELTAARSYSLKDLCYITLYVKNMSEYSKMNEVYLDYIDFESPPTRVCVECTLPDDCQVIMEAVGFKTKSESLLI